MPGQPSYPVLSTDSRLAARWLILALSAITIGGLFALGVLIARVPIFAEHIPASMSPLFERTLAVHVNLAFGVWFYCWLVVLFLQLPQNRDTGLIHRAIQWIAAIGVACFVAAIALPDAPMIKSNYVPVLDTPLFMGGLLAFWFAVALTFLQPRLVRPGSAMAALPGVSGSAGSAIRVAGLIYLLAMLTFIGAWMTTPDTHTGWPFYELLFWGAGHVLQFANEAGMLAAWLILLTHALGPQPVSRNVVRALLAVLIIPPLAGPVLTFMGVTGEHHYDSFTRLMQWGIFPVVTVMLVLCMTACFRNTQNAPRGRGALRPLLRHPSFTGFAASAFLTVTGFVLGGLISLVPESTTLIPAHYHAAIGAVTVAYMAVTFVLLESWGIPIASERLRRMSVWQPLLFGIGQFVMALGFAIAGYHKAARKVYGADQQVRSTGEYVGLVIMGIGGAFAIVGGVMFLIIVIRSYVVARRANRAA